VISCRGVGLLQSPGWKYGVLLRNIWYLLVEGTAVQLRAALVPLAAIDTTGAAGGMPTFSLATSALVESRAADDALLPVTKACVPVSVAALYAQSSLPAPRYVA